MILEKETIELPYGLKAIFKKSKYHYKCSGNDRTFIHCDIKQGREYLGTFDKLIEENGEKVKGEWV